MEDKSLLSNRVVFSTILIVAVFQIVLAFVYPVIAFDSVIHLNWLGQFTHLFHVGTLYPRWMPQSFWGFGSPAFYYYPPLTYWIAGVISYFSESPIFLYRSIGLLTLSISSFTCFLYVRTLTSHRKVAILGALLYSVLPYRVIDLYFRNALGEHVAFIFFPLIFLGMELSVRENRKARLESMIVSSIGWGGLILTNIPSAIIAAYVAPIYLLLRLRMLRRWINMSVSVSGAIVGIMISAIYIVPILKLRSSIKLSHLWDLWKGEGYTGNAIVDAFHDAKYKTLYGGLIVTVFCGALLLHQLIKSYKREQSYNLRSKTIAWSGILSISIIVQIPFIIQPVWDFLPFLNIVQFTWRFDMLIVIASVVSFVMIASNAEGNISRWILAGLCGFGVLLASNFFIANNGCEWKYQAQQGNIDAPEYLPASANDNVALAIERFHEHAAEPIVAFIRSQDSTERITVTDSITSSIAFVGSGISKPVGVVFRRAFFPTWKLRGSAGQNIPIIPDSIGRITAILPAIESSYRLAIENIPEEKQGRIISVIGVSILGLLSLVRVFWRNPKAS